MRLAVVGWAGDSGVGRELIDAVRNLPVSCAFILENPSKPTRKDLLLGTPSYFANAANLDKQMELFIECHRPDTILTWEVPGAWTFPAVWARKDVKWVHMVHWDWFSTADEHLPVWKSARLLAPNAMCQRELKAACELDAELLPVPVDTKRLVFRERKKADLFISVYGYGGPKDRRSIPEIVETWKRLGPTPPRLVIRAQKPVEELKGVPPPNGISVELGNAPEPADLYKVGDVALQPSRYEGVGVSLVEAQACGMPVIAIDAEPMKDIVCGPLISVEKTTRIPIMSKPLFSHIPSVKSMVSILTSLKGKDVSELSRKARVWAEEKFSWAVLRDRWIETLSRK
jgi:glycosyltransferase involved in cell wall biosynthesis